MNQLAFLSKANGRQVQSGIQNALSTCTEPKLALLLLDFCLPEEPTTTSLLPSCCVPVPALEPLELFDLLIIVCGLCVSTSVYFQINIHNIVYKGAYMLQVLVQWNGVRFVRIYFSLIYEEILGSSETTRKQTGSPFAHQALQRFQWLPWPQVEKS